MTGLWAPSLHEISFAVGINDSGQISGYSEADSGQRRAFLYSNGVMMDLGLPGSIGEHINNSGEVTGAAGHAFRWNNGLTTDLGTLGGLGSFGRAAQTRRRVSGGVA